MSKYLSRIEDIINQTSPQWALTHMVPRGFPYFVDPSMRGSTRFAKRTGSFLPNLTAENLTALSADSLALQSVITVKRVLNDFAPGVVISIGPGLELNKIRDVGDAGEIILTSQLRSNHPSGESVQMYAIPASIVGTVTSGQTVFNITSTVPVFKGDKLWIDTVVGSLESSVHFEITEATPINPWPNTITGLYTTTIIISLGVPRTFVNGDIVYLRTLPAYTSTILNVPVQSKTSASVGPFVIDYLSGRLNDGEEIEETLNFQAFTSLGTPVLGANPISAAKNYPIINMPIPNTALLFWDVIKGTLSYRNGKVLLQTDSSGQFAISTPLIPFFPGNSKLNTGSWKVPVKMKSTVAAVGLLRFKFAPNGYQDFSLTPDVPALPAIEVGAADANRCEIVFASTPGSYVEVDNWFPVANRISTLQYTIIANAIGDTDWQAGSLQVKPYFFTLDSLVGKFDFDRFNSGRVSL